jgi:hypothetical protein
MRRSSSPLCKSCVHRYFWEYTALTALGGWWGITSALLTPLILLSNVFKYLVCCLALKPVPAGAAPPQLTPEAVQRLRPFAKEMAAARKKGIKPAQIASRVAPLAGVTPAQVMLFIWSKELDRQLSISAGHIIEMPTMDRPVAPHTESG